MATWASEAHIKVSPTDFCFPITLDFAENGPLLYLPSGYYPETRDPESNSQLGPAIGNFFHRSYLIS